MAAHGDAAAFDEIYSRHRRFVYSVAVRMTRNLAARIEKLNKKFGSQLLISEMVWQGLGEAVSEAIPMGNVQVRGREETIRLYQVA